MSITAPLIRRVIYIVQAIIIWAAIGDGTATRKTSMTKVLGGLKWKSFHQVQQHTCGVTMEGEGLCWGYSGYHTLGNGSTDVMLHLASQKIDSGRI